MRTTLTGNVSRKGQALVEMSVVVLILVPLVAGIIEFGRMLMITNMITQASRDAARVGAALPVKSGSGTAYRDSGTGLFTSAGQQAIKDRAIEVARNAGVVLTSDQVVVDPTPAVDGTPLVKVTINTSIAYIFNLVGSSLDVHRSSSFRDEYRSHA